MAMATALKARAVFLGAPGAGKGTQAKQVAEAATLAHISTGDMLRAAVKEGTEFGLQAKAIMDAGQLVSDEVMLGIISERLAEPDAATGWLLDGFPRTEQQAKDLVELMGSDGIDLALDLVVPEEVVIDRITGRRVCSSCQTTYSTGRDESATTGVCAKCGGEVVQRDDDTEEAVRKRLAIYATQTLPAVRWFGEQGLLVTIDGVGDPDEIAVLLAEAIDARIS